MTGSARGTTTLPSLSETHKYAVGGVIAAGEVVEVLRAELRGADDFRRPVVIEKVQPRYARDPVFLKRFVDQARLAARLTHANIVQVIDFGHTGDQHFVVLESIDGADLSLVLARLRRAGVPRLPVPLAVSLVTQLLKAVDHAHHATDPQGRPLGYVHGDVRPGTVRLSRDGQVKLAVFDSGRAADDAWSLSGSEPGFRAPELLAGEAPDRRTDVYGAGVILFELLTGQALFAPGRRRTVADQIRRGRVPRLRSLGVPAELERVLLTAVDRRREKRFADAETFLQALLAASVPRFGTASTRDLAALVERALDPFTPRGEGEGEWSLGAAAPGTADPAWVAGNAAPGAASRAASVARRSLVTVVLTTAALSGAAGAAWYLRLF